MALTVVKETSGEPIPKIEKSVSLPCPFNLTKIKTNDMTNFRVLGSDSNNEPDTCDTVPFLITILFMYPSAPLYNSLYSLEMRGKKRGA